MVLLGSLRTCSTQEKRGGTLPLKGIVVEFSFSDPGNPALAMAAMGFMVFRLEGGF